MLRHRKTTGTVFFSYRRYPLTLDWTRGVHSIPKLWLQEELPHRQIQKFVDEESIETGELRLSFEHT